MYGLNTFRWDIQRARALREHEELLRKYRMKAGQSQEKKKEKVTTLLPNMSESKLCERRERERERERERKRERERERENIIVCSKNRLFTYIVLLFS